MAEVDMRTIKDAVFLTLITLLFVVGGLVTTTDLLNPIYGGSVVFAILAILPWIKKDEVIALEDKLNRVVANFGKGKFARVLRMARKPSMEEFKSTLLITGVGMLIIGGIGFVIYLTVNFLPSAIESLFK